MGVVVGAVLLVLGVVGVMVLSRKIEAVHADVRTLKGQRTLGQIGGEGESDRIEAIPHDERTATEQRHLDSAALREAPQGPLHREAE